MAIEFLIFDLDDTLYPPTSGVWEAIGDRIDLFMMENLNLTPETVTTVRDDLYHQYGTTLRGLQIVYGIDPYKYLNFVHNVPLEDYLQPNPILRSVLSSIVTRKAIFTNSDQNHALRVLERLGLAGIFQRIIDVMDVAPFCKPQPEAFVKALQILGNPFPADCILIEDSLRNVVTAKELGFKTILVGRPNGSSGAVDASLNSLEELLELENSMLMHGVWRKS